MHDRNGTPLKKGDIVNLPCVVMGVQPSDEYCNVELVTIYPSRSDKAKTSFSALNTAQIVLVERPVPPVNDIKP